MGRLKTAFLQWKRENYPEIELSDGQVLYMRLYWENVESASSEPLPDVEGKSVIQMLLSGFWEDEKYKL